MQMLTFIKRHMSLVRLIISVHTARKHHKHTHPGVYHSESLYLTQVNLNHWLVNKHKLRYAPNN